jgi:hypothetical protein
MTPNDFLKIIHQEIYPIEEVPEGWYSTEQLVEMWGIEHSSVQKKIKAGKKLGYVTQRKFLIKKNKIISVPYYKFHEKENNQKVNKRENMENIVRSCGKNKRSR